MKRKPALIVVCGPTASGKTGLAVDLAKYFQTEVISSDSRQFYRELNIGTAKPSIEEQKGIKHHFIDSLGIEESYSAGDFEKQALETLDTIFNKTEVTIMAGGSGLFIDAVCNGLDVFPDIPEDIKLKVRSLYEKKGNEGLISKLKIADPEYLEIVDQKNPQRLTRALEVSLASGKPFSSFRKNAGKKRYFDTLKIALEWDREILYDRINQRVDIMIDNGLEEEAKSLLPYRHLNALQTVGYQEWFPYFDGEYDKAEAIRLIKRNSRRYAKRQLTWFRRDSTIRYFSPDVELSSIIEYLED